MLILARSGLLQSDYLEGKFIGETSLFIRKTRKSGFGRTTSPLTRPQVLR
jgi:hypothetical protein